MSVAVVTVQPGFVQDNLQRSQMFTGQLTIGPDINAVYPTGGIPVLAALIAALFPTSNDPGPHSVEFWSTKGSGYIYTYIKSTGTMMILQAPPAGSLTTAAPLQQLGSNSQSLSGVVIGDVIGFRATWRRNASG